jgi:hypothetical protein
MRGRVIVACALAACGHIGFDDLPPASPLTWWDTTYTKRAQLAIKNVSADPMVTGFEVELAFDINTLDAPGALDDGLRVVYLDPTTHMWTEQQRFVQAQWLWFDLLSQLDPGATTTDYWLYFGNPMPPTPSFNGNAVFEFYDGFANPTVNTAKWAVLGSPTQAGNHLLLGNGESVRSLSTFTAGNTFFTVTKTTSNPEIWAGFQRVSDFVDDIPWMLWIERQVTDTYYPAGVPTGSIWPEVSLAGNVFAQGTTGARVLDGAQHLYTIERLADRVEFKVDEQIVYEYVLATPDNESLQIRLTNYGTAQLSIDAVHVARAVWPEPTVTIGTTELQ